MTVITVKTPRGIMRINADKFFPCTQQNLKKLITIITDPWTGESDEKLKEICDFLQEKIIFRKWQHDHYKGHHNDMCDDTKDFFDLMYLKKHGEITTQVLNGITKDIVKLERNLEFIQEI